MRIPRPRWSWRLAAAAPLTLLTTVLAVPASATSLLYGASHPQATPAPAAVTRTVALPSGDTVKLTSAGHGRYAAIPGPGEQVPLAVQAFGSGTSGTSAIYVIPATASAYVADGSLDRGMFDVLWLASHPAADIVLQYQGQRQAAWLAARATALPGAAVVASAPRQGTVTVHVAAARARAFWAALTGLNGPWRVIGGLVRPHLADGIARAWLAGHQTPAVARPAVRTLFTVTETIKRTGGINPGDNSLYGVTGPLADAQTKAATLVCVTGTNDDCSAWRSTFQVPAGVYDADSLGTFLKDDSNEVIDLGLPQFTVAGDTSITIDADKAVEVAIKTPLPSATYTGVITHYRTTGNGRFFFNALIPAPYAFAGWWAMPTAHPVTVGAFHLETDWTLGAPPVTMSVQGSGGLQLHPLYEGYNAHATTVQALFKRFSGHQTAQLVAAGTGTTQDFSHVNAHGKLVLLSVKPDAGCKAYAWQLTNARQAGAIGVLYDPADPAQTLGTCTSHPLPLDQAPGALPYVTIPHPEAAALDARLARGAVTIAVADAGAQSPYIYNLKFYAENSVPASLHYTVTGSQLAQVSTAYHSPRPAEEDFAAAAFDPGTFSWAGTAYQFLAPWADREYDGPLSPDRVWMLMSESNGGDQEGFTTFTAPAARSLNLWEQPEAPGAATVDSGSAAVLPTLVQQICSMCRQGDFLYPNLSLISGAAPGIGHGQAVGMPKIHLYRANGTEIPASSDNGYDGYTGLPAAKARYRLVESLGVTNSTWWFSSQRPATTTSPGTEQCIGTISKFSADPCGAEPMIFLRYNAHVSLTDTVTADASHQIQVTPYYQAAKAPASVTSLKLWTSVNGGKTWQPVTLHRNADGSYTGTYQVPALSATNGTVSLKAQAADSAGDTLTQVSTGAYGLAAAH